jgi:hypothetical protein
MLSKKILTDEILNSVRIANEEYFSMSGGQWITDAGIESYVVSKIASSVFKKCNGEMITMEYYPRYVIEESEAKRDPGPLPASIRGSKRIDLVFYSKSAKPYAISEVKKYSNKKSLERDIFRVADCLDRAGTARDGSLRYGLVVSYFANINKKNGEFNERKYNNFVELVQDSCAAKNLQCENFTRKLSDDFWKGWTLWANCALLTPNPDAN